MTVSDMRNQRGPGQRSFFRGMAVGVTVFVSGAAVMIYEFVAVRFLQRNFGGSLDVWASEIAVCMAGLALGYWLGGLLADRFKSWRVLGLILVVAGLAALFMEPIADGIGAALLPRPPAWWHPLAAAGGCSFLPLLALGTVLPQGVRLHVRELDRVGAVTGWIAAVSTVGSIAGVLSTAMVFLPRFGVRETLWGVSVGVVGFGLVVAGAAQLMARKRAVALALLSVIFAVPQAEAQIIFEQYTAFHHILVEDRPHQRILWFDNAPQSTMSRRDPVEGGFEYTDFFHVPILLDPTIRSALFVGLGGGTGPKVFLRDYPHLRIDGVEIDPVVARIARDFFAVPDDPRLNVTIADGRVFLRRASQTYGAIIMDAYASGPYGAYLPYHLATREFFEVAWNRLANGGTLVYNVIGVYGGLNDSTIRDMHATLAAVFQQVYVFRARSSLNTVFAAQKIDARTWGPDGAPDLPGWPQGPWLQHPLTSENFTYLATTLQAQGVIRRPILAKRVAQFSKGPSGPTPARILTDNYAPVDIAAGRGGIGPAGQ